MAKGQEVIHKCGADRTPIALTNKPDLPTGQTHRLTLTLLSTNPNHL